MADLATHAAFAAVPALALRDPRTRLLLVIGAFLPDIVAKGLSEVMRAPTGFDAPAHSVPGLMVLCYLLALFLAEPLRVTGFFALYAGSLAHILSDIPKDCFGASGIPLWFPFSYRLAEVSLILPENTIFFAPGALLFLTFFLKSEWKPRDVPPRGTP